MAKKRVKTETKPAINPRATGRARDVGTVRAVSVEIPIAIDDALERVRERRDRTKKSMILMALKLLLYHEREWPEPPPEITLRTD